MTRTPYVIATGLMILLGGCYSSEIGPEIKLKTDQMHAFLLDGQTIVLNKQYSGLTTDPYVNQLISSVESWCQQYIQPSGTSGRILVDLDDVVARDVPLPTKGSTFTIEQAGQLEASIALKISIQDDSGFTRRSYVIRANRSQTYPEKATLKQKELIFQSVVNGVINALNDKMNQTLG